MKVRQGFVSNSSSSSFIVQTKLPLSEALEINKKTLCFDDGIDLSLYFERITPLSEWIVEQVFSGYVVEGDDFLKVLDENRLEKSKKRGYKDLYVLKVENNKSDEVYSIYDELYNRDSLGITKELKHLYISKAFSYD